ncbi:hypothetical protein [Gluconacetobacter tumulisoli]|uniref:Uncharacterized protein n=1 Tax=Gluconacetobacter tumulisoli TaxID=1286189 RepID=A0A7W4K565_9PROT|nr:hypothetical protein [Gluconacetobacter tumulisoli]MBB2200556.1 hypothetical protein [Gluconacetobacter tumulisoli]
MPGGPAVRGKDAGLAGHDPASFGGMVDLENSMIADLERRLAAVERTLDEIVTSLEKYSPQDAERRVRLLATIVGSMAAALRTLASRIDGVRTRRRHVERKGRGSGKP